uniref:Uncharacterized protein n=1 Tax=Siphoviridae sp. ctX5W26 TaxID=2825540 RepID=A0A8S5UEX0_9CAUD|nr:MAG TPA: hypothetical protein [Siphoviridae sp. ctX5W26]
MTNFKLYHTIIYAKDIKSKILQLDIEVMSL